MKIDLVDFNKNEKPNLNLSEEKKKIVLGKYELKNYLIQVEKVAKNREEFLINEMIKKEKNDEKLKDKNQIQ